MQVTIEVDERHLDDLINAMECREYSDKVDSATNKRARIVLNKLLEIRWNKPEGYFGESTIKGD